MSDARRVAATVQHGTLLHAIWVDGNTEPFQYYMSGTAEGIRRSRLATGQIREGLAECGAFLPTVVAGAPEGPHSAKPSRIWPVANRDRRIPSAVPLM